MKSSERPKPTHVPPPNLDRVEDADSQERYNVAAMHAPIIREKQEPRDGFEPIPPWIAIFYGALIFWGGYYLARYSGDFRADIYDENNRGGVAKEKAPEDPIAMGKRLFTGNCAACHQPTGLGNPGQTPPLAGSEWVVGKPEVLIRILLHGLQGPVTVKGANFNGNMPPFGAKLKPDQIAAVLTFIRQEWGNQASPISPEMVQAVMTSAGNRGGQWTVPELDSVPPIEGVAPPEAEPSKEGEKSAEAAPKS